MFDADDKFGTAATDLPGAKKRLRMGIKVLPEGDGTGGMVFYDQSGNARVFPDGRRGWGRGVEPGREGQKGGIAMAVAADGTPSLKMTDKAGKVLFQAPADSN